MNSENAVWAQGFNAPIRSFVVAISALMAISSVPAKISFSRFRQFDHGTTIRLDRTSLPFAALEDVASEELSKQSEELPTQNVHTLVAGTAYFPEIANLENENKAHSISLPPVLVSKQDLEIQQLIAQLNSELKIQQTKIWETSSPPQQKYQKAKAQQTQQPNLLKEMALKEGEIISGEIEVTGGMAFVGGGQRLTIQRYDNGKAIEEGKVHLKQGTFEIRVAEKKGRLIAQLTNENGEVIGEGAYAFSLAPPNVNHHIKIKLSGKSKGIGGQVLSAYSFGEQKIVVGEAHVALDDLETQMTSDEDGNFMFEGFSDSSVALLRASATGYMPTIQFASGSKPNEVMLYPKKMVESLLSITNSQLGKTEGIIWGQVLSQSKPIMGARVEIAGLNKEPIYFNKLYLPDEKLKESTASGYFVFLGVPPGLHQVRAIFSGKILDGAVIPVAAGYVSPIRLESADATNQIQMVFTDPYAHNKISPRGLLKIFGTEEIKNFENDPSIIMPAKKLLSFFDAIAENFYPSRILTGGIRPQFEVPLLSPEWLNKVISNGGYSVDFQKGAIFIHTQVPPYYLAFNGKEVALTDKNIIPIEGQGLLLVNVPIGVNTVITKMAEFSDADMNVIIADPGTVNIIDLRRQVIPQP